MIEMAKYDKRGEIYFWIKLRQDLMYSKEIKLLMRQPDGGWYFSIYIYLVMLTINSNGRLIQKVHDVEMIYDLSMITQELMFFKIDTIRVAIEMLKSIGLLYVDDEQIICITNFNELVGSTTGWAEIKKKQRERKMLENNNGDNVPQIVHENVHIEYRDKRLENRDDILDTKSIDPDIYDKYDIYDKITFTSDSSINEKIKNLMINEWHIEFSNAHILTKYLVYSKYLEEGDLNSLQDANSFFEKKKKKRYEFEDLKNHIHYFLFQYRKMPTKDKKLIKNKLAYLTNAIKKNQRTIEWLSSEEYQELSKVNKTVDKVLTKEAKELFPDDEVKQTIYYNEYYLSTIGKEIKRIKSEFNKKTSVRR